MADPGFTVSTDQDVRSDEDIDVVINGCGAVPYVVDLDVEIEQHIEVEQVSEIDLDADDACADLAVAVDVDQEAYLEQLGEVDIDIEEDDGLVSVDLEVDIVQTIRIEDAIRVDAAGGDDGENAVKLDVEQDVRTVQKLDVDIDIDEEVLALVNVDADQCAALFQDVDVLIDFLSGSLVAEVDTVQDADLDDSLVISFDIQGTAQVQISEAIAAHAGIGAAGVEAPHMVGGLGGVAHGALAGGSAVAALGAGPAGGETVHGTGGVGAAGSGDLPDGGDNRASALPSDGSDAPGIAASAVGVESLRWIQGGGIVDLGDSPGAAVSDARFGPDEGAIAVGSGTGASQPGGLPGDAIIAMDAPAALSGLLLAGRTFNQASDVSRDGWKAGSR